MTQSQRRDESEPHPVTYDITEIREVRGFQHDSESGTG